MKYLLMAVLLITLVCSVWSLTFFFPCVPYGRQYGHWILTTLFMGCTDQRVIAYVQDTHPIAKVLFTITATGWFGLAVTWVVMSWRNILKGPSGDNSTVNDSVEDKKK